MGSLSGVGKNLTQQRHRGGFAIRAGDGHHLTGSQLISQLHLTNHINAVRLGLLHKRNAVRNAGADHQHVLPSQHIHGRAAQCPLHRQVLQR